MGWGLWNQCFANCQQLPYPLTPGLGCDEPVKWLTINLQEEGLFFSCGSGQRSSEGLQTQVREKIAKRCFLKDPGTRGLLRAGEERRGAGRARASGSIFTVAPPSFCDGPGVLCGLKVPPWSESAATFGAEGDVVASATAERCGRNGKVREGWGGGQGARLLRGAEDPSLASAVSCRRASPPGARAPRSRLPAAGLGLSSSTQTIVPFAGLWLALDVFCINDWNRLSCRDAFGVRILVS